MKKRFSASVSKDTQEAILRNIYIPQILKDKIYPPEDIQEKNELDLSSNSSKNNVLLMYSENDKKRPLEEKNGNKENKQIIYQTPFRIDYARIVHSPSFRRLQGKTQLFPCVESDFFRNRLTHSIEVAHIAKTIAMKINSEHFKDDMENRIDLDLIEIAGLAHDMGHPPFGHQGEEALNSCMNKFGGFEGNAQTFRLLSKIEKKRQAGELELGGFDKDGLDKRYGLNLTYRSLATILKYDEVIPEHTEKVKKGYYKSEKKLVEKIKSIINGGKTLGHKKFKTIECCIMDIADDIAYSTFDLEDAFKGGFINPMDIINLDSSFHDEVSEKVNHELKEKNQKSTIGPSDIKFIVSDIFKDLLFNLDPLVGLTELDPEFLKTREFNFLAVQYADKYSDYLADDGYTRSDFSSQLIDTAINAVQFKLNEETPALSSVSLQEDSLVRIEILKQIAFKTQVLSPKLKIAEYRGKEIIQKIFDALNDNPKLMPYDIRRIHDAQSDADTMGKKRIICDYIASMTDRYAIELYGRLTSETPATIFKPY